MAKLITLETKGCKTYITRDNAIRAFNDKFGDNDDVRFIVMQDERGRWFPVGIGNSALQAGVHFHFHVMN